MSKKVGVIVGSLRKDSLNRKMANVLMALAPEAFKFEIIEIAELPLYNEDLDKEDNLPLQWKKFREQVKSCDAVLFVTPEYNRSIPGALKNAIDVGSRPYGASAWDSKPGAVISVSPSAAGGFGSNQHLRQTFVFLNILCMQQPEAYIGQAHNLFDAKGEINNDGTRKFLQNFIDSYIKWVETILR